MAQVTRIHPDRPAKLHYIPEWAQKRGMKQADIVRNLPVELRVNKSTVHRWFHGIVPDKREHLMALAEMFHLDEVASLFRHPDDDWIARRLRGKTDQEKEIVIRWLEVSFPDPPPTGRKTGTGG